MGILKENTFPCYCLQLNVGFLQEKVGLKGILGYWVTCNFWLWFTFWNSLFDVCYGSIMFHKTIILSRFLLYNLIISTYRKNIIYKQMPKILFTKILELHNKELNKIP